MNRSLSTGTGLLTAAAIIAAAVVSPEVARSAPGATLAASASASAAPSASAASAAAAAPPAGTAASAPVAGPSSNVSSISSSSSGMVKLKKGAPPPPPPTSAQLKALGILQQEAQSYEDGSKDYRRNLTMIVRHHYEQRRQRVLTALDREITDEKQTLDEARQEAIARLESFVERYSGANADPKATPDAMFRLGALYEERARANTDADLTTGLDPAIAMYRRLIKEFPQYEEIAAVHYYLGHSYTDAGRIEEGQQAWRSLVCNNRYTVKDDPKDAGKIALDPLPQDHDDKFWQDWYNRNPVPLDQVGKGKRPVPRPAPRKGKASAAPTKAAAGGDAEERTFVDPYEGCVPLPQKTEPGQDPRYLSEIWWQLGNFHFDQIDPHGGPYNLNRAVSAYDRSMEYKTPPIYGVAMYKQAWTYYKQQRYKTAVEWFVKLLRYADEQEAKTGDPGADFRSEAYTYIAGSLTYVDFDGPPPQDPYIPRNDVLDTETDPVKAEQKMAIAIQRVQDPALIPQDQKWTVEIYKALAQEYIEITQNRNAVAMLELTLQKFPMNRDAPVMQNKIAELYDELTRLAPEGSAARADYASKALEARTKLAAYVGTTPWVDANKDDPEALQTAEQLVKGGLKRAAADHTNFARGYYQKALELNDAGEQRGLIEKAIAEYRLAETGWSAYLDQDPTAMDAYESRYWLADARYWVAVLQIAIDRTPTPEEIRAAHDSAVAVRDSNEDDKYLQPAAYDVVTLAERVLDDLYRQYDESKGTKGIEKRTELRFSGEGDARKPIKDDVPPAVLDAIRARDEYN
ncbi:MAG TPA: tetratricopeptide repeat protein, partial [Polyangiaceae bacterium]|nr:tetratricopeptide repeat protein [Polyangiaceae bacterium]